MSRTVLSMAEDHHLGPLCTLQEEDSPLEVAQGQPPKTTLRPQVSTQWNQPPLLGQYSQLYQEREEDLNFAYKKPPSEEQFRTHCYAAQISHEQNQQCVVQVARE